MATPVGFSPKCRIDFGERTPERWALVRESIRALIDLLGTTGGLLPTARRVNIAPVDRYVLEDANWRIIYVRTETIGSLGNSVHVTLEDILLKLPPA